MANEIKVPSFLNYADCRPKAEEKPTEKKLSEIEKEAIVNYAKSMSVEEMNAFLNQVQTEVLLAHISFRVLDTECKLHSLQKRILDTL